MLLNGRKVLVVSVSNAAVDAVCKAILRHLPKARHRDIFRNGPSLDPEVLPLTAAGRLAEDYPDLGLRIRQTRDRIQRILKPDSNSETQLRDLAAAKRVIKYLVGTPKLSLIYRKVNKLELVAFSDSDWAGDPTSRKSTSGYCFRLDPTSSAISWMSRMQRSTALSSCEAEFYAASITVQEAIWIRGIWSAFTGQRLLPPTTLYCDNQATVRLGDAGTSHKRMKHILIRLAFLREHVERGTIIMRYITTSANIADFFTKPLGRLLFIRLRDAIMKGGPVVVTT